MVFEGDFCGVLDLHCAASKRRTQPGGGHGACRTNFALTADFGTADAGVGLDQSANRCSGQQKRGDIG